MDLKQFTKELALVDALITTQNSILSTRFSQTIKTKEKLYKYVYTNYSLDKDPESYTEEGIKSTSCKVLDCFEELCRYNDINRINPVNSITSKECENLRINYYVKRIYEPFFIFLNSNKYVSINSKIDYNVPLLFTPIFSAFAITWYKESTSIRSGEQYVKCLIEKIQKEIYNTIFVSPVFYDMLKNEKISGEYVGLYLNCLYRYNIYFFYTFWEDNYGYLKMQFTEFSRKTQIKLCGAIVDNFELKYRESIGFQNSLFSDVFSIEFYTLSNPLQNAASYNDILKNYKPYPCNPMMPIELASPIVNSFERDYSQIGDRIIKHLKDTYLRISRIGNSKKNYSTATKIKRIQKALSDFSIKEGNIYESYVKRIQEFHADFQKTIDDRVVYLADEDQMIEDYKDFYDRLIQPYKEFIEELTKRIRIALKSQKLEIKDIVDNYPIESDTEFIRNQFAMREFIFRNHFIDVSSYVPYNLVQLSSEIENLAQLFQDEYTDKSKELSIPTKNYNIEKEYSILDQIEKELSISNEKLRNSEYYNLLPFNLLEWINYEIE